MEQFRQTSAFFPETLQLPDVRRQKMHGNRSIIRGGHECIYSKLSGSQIELFPENRTEHLTTTKAAPFGDFRNRNIGICRNDLARTVGETVSDAVKQALRKLIPGETGTTNKNRASSRPV